MFPNVSISAITARLTELTLYFIICIFLLVDVTSLSAVPKEQGRETRLPQSMVLCSLPTGPRLPSGKRAIVLHTNLATLIAT